MHRIAQERRSLIVTIRLQLAILESPWSARPGHDLAAQACRRHVFVIGRGIPANRAGMKQAPLDLLDYRDLNRPTRRHGLAGDVQDAAIGKADGHRVR